ncbi:hypothetical protein F9L16_04570 [Agarivorans sp. B2Z047]|uniref:hypothetical protein n=1 Tax=Agarivorans sp. B2Z047 TaxID=2652721 RepID=UPI001406E704|nr:hypothetical protein [Agarivorans sp. B2Z047]MPW28273.1 hypothetical protein [Agarivorans sp. B2Z047]UQN43899.1 hypothetical protein LQZ07_05370 [Agarivorans sp. B2Z047]
MNLPKSSPTVFCKLFLERELDSFKEVGIWGSYWQVMQRMIDRADELTTAFEELVDSFGYSDKFEGTPPTNSYIWLTLEHIWGSIDYRKDEVGKVRKDFNELSSVNEEIVDLSNQLAAALRRQRELYEYSGFNRESYQSVTDAIVLGSEGNYLFERHLAAKLRSLNGQYDSRYWPDRADVVEAICSFEALQPAPTHGEFSESVLSGRATDIKDFVIAFDGKFDAFNDLPDGFRFSNKAMADLINVVLDMSPDKLIIADAVRNVRNRYKSR